MEQVSKKEEIVEKEKEVKAEDVVKAEETAKKEEPAKKEQLSTRALVSLAMLGAISVVLIALIRFPLIPAAAFLEYDPADIPILIGTFAFGPVAGFLLTVVVSVIQGVTVSAGSGWIGVIMHICSTGACALVAGTIYQRKKTRKMAAVALTCGALAQTAVMVVMNLIFMPLFIGQPMSVVLAMMVPVIIPFNLLKAGINCALTFMLYKPLSHLIKGQ